MKLAAKYDIEAPADFVYRELSDFDAWERMALRRGAEVTRVDTLAKPGPGLEWLVSFKFRAKYRSLRIRLTEARAASHMTVTLQAGLADGVITIDLMDLATTRTRVDVRLEVKPKTFAARLYMQTLRLSRKKVEATYSQRVAQLAVEMEDRYRRPAARAPR
ncbi:SRPBCC family protein [bacterium]|nr:SRPBCC family protein [bacterium]